MTKDFVNSLDVIHNSYLELFDNNMDDIILRRYYVDFLAHVYPDVVNLINENKDPYDLKLNLFEDKAEINRKNQRIMNEAFAKYYCGFNDDKIVNYLTGEAKDINNDLADYIHIKDIFRVDYGRDPKYEAKHPAIIYCYSSNSWNGMSELLDEQTKAIETKLSKKSGCDVIKDIEDYETFLKGYVNYVEEEKTRTR